MKNLAVYLEGKKTYLVAIMLLLSVALETGLGVDVPGFETPENWLIIVLNALGLSALRAGVEKVAAK